MPHAAAASAGGADPLANFLAQASHLAANLARRAGVSFESEGLEACPFDVHVLEELADRLWHARGKSLAVCGSQDTGAGMARSCIRSSRSGRFRPS